MPKFSERLQDGLVLTGLSVTDAAEKLNKKPQQIMQWLDGSAEPYRTMWPDIAHDLGLPPDYFHHEPPDSRECFNLSVSAAAKAMGKSKQFVAVGLQQGRFPWGWAVKLDDWSYFISSVKFSEFTGIKL